MEERARRKSQWFFMMYPWNSQGHYCDILLIHTAHSCLVWEGTTYRCKHQEARLPGSQPATSGHCHRISPALRLLLPIASAFSLALPGEGWRPEVPHLNTTEAKSENSSSQRKMDPLTVQLTPPLIRTAPSFPSSVKLGKSRLIPCPCPPLSGCLTPPWTSHISWRTSACRGLWTFHLTRPSDVYVLLLSMT